MLKSLELAGFKSFADKTRFEFDGGVTVVVGPNGSGKSNVVDGVKWVLGDQSPRSMRGKEMTDVIFNGSAGRAPLNSAEVTLTLDNRDRFFDIDTDEVHITRRVYRSGEGEYLINRQACRLRDIRDLLAGTGIGGGAYSIIEQGKVDSLLQASPRDRRLIFEEAAGIARFRAKKVETQRRLERVEQNLVRLKDIVDEVDNRLKAVRNQASKARRYREFTDRLQALRTQAGQADWRKLSDQLTALETELETLRARRDELQQTIAQLEAQHAAQEKQLTAVEEAIRQREGEAAQDRERIAAHESATEHERARIRELEDQIARLRNQLAATNMRAGDLHAQWRETRAAAAAIEEERQALEQQLAEDEAALAQVNERLSALRETNEQRRANYVERMRACSVLGKEISVAEGQLGAVVAGRQRAENRIAEAEQRQAQLEDELAQIKAQGLRIREHTENCRDALAVAQARLAERRQQLAAIQEQLAELGQQRTGLRERASLLNELEQRLEGLEAGTQAVLLESRAAQGGPLKHVLGVVAELFEVHVQTAPLIELALGEAVGRLVVEPHPEFWAYLRDRGGELPGRVSFLPMPAPSAAKLPNLDGEPGVIGRADRFVDTAPRFRPLAEALLGSTWVVESLEHALRLSPYYGGSTRHAGVSLVTLAGELVAPDGTVTVGPAAPTADHSSHTHFSTGLITRRSTLAELEKQLQIVQQEIAEAEAERDQTAALIEEEEVRAEELAAQYTAASEAWGEHRQKVLAMELRLNQLSQQREIFDAELAAAETRYQAVEAELQAARDKLQAAESALDDMEATIAQTAREIIAMDQERQDALQQVTTSKVSLAKCEERLGALQRRLAQFEQDQQDRNRAVAELEQELANCAARALQSERAILRAESLLALLYLNKERLQREVQDLAVQRERLRRERTAANQQVTKLNTELRRVEDAIHAKDLEAGEIRLNRETLAVRLREDYGIEIADLEAATESEDIQQREAVDREIADLRHKLATLGSVNMEALNELDELEERFARLSAQWQDLTQAKQSLEQIIQRINADSRRLFVETFEMVRGHFQTLYRKLFGGGQADLVLDTGVDILEAGVDINARPPGKELRSISLLSGGEKTLTCVALLLALFRSRPSPFCMLDEVDAALDEANVGRFIEVVKEFAAETQFIVITHSKKTMTCANTLYGVTMQESGVSKRVSVRFEDVSDDGEISVRDDAQADHEAA